MLVEKKIVPTGLRLQSCTLARVRGERIALVTGEQGGAGGRLALAALACDSGRELWRDEFPEEPGRLAMGAEVLLLDLGDGCAGVAHFVAHRESGANSLLRVLEPLSGEELLRVEVGVWYGGNRDVHCLDVDGDGECEIVAGFSDRLACFRVRDGALKWVNAERMGICWGRSAIADLDGDGVPEIVLGSEYGNPDGTSSIFALRGGDGSVLWEYAGIEGDCGSTPTYLLDVNGDGVPEVVKTEIDLEHRGPVNMARLWCLSASGELLWRADLGGGDIAIGDLDGDGVPEAVAITSGRDGGEVSPSVRCVELGGGTLKWSVPLERHWLTGWPTEADVDGDGRPEAILAHGNPSGYGRLPGADPWGEVLVVKGDGGIGQRLAFRDHVPDVDACDWDGDGAAEVIVACGDGNLYVYGMA